MSEKTEIVICLGSSCFARGNKKTLQAIEDFIKKHQLQEKVFFHGSHCFGKCENGPVLKINSTIYEQVNAEKALQILSAEFQIS